MENWEVYIVEGREWIVHFHASNPGQHLPWNIVTTACPTARINPYAGTQQYAWDNKVHPVHAVYPKIRGQRVEWKRRGFS